nr:PREDICTED: uncharacterized protein LOC105673433 [Linepithema humile]
MALTIIQTNANHSGGAQDLLLQNMREWRTSLAIVAEPYMIPESPRWWGSTGKFPKVAIIWGGGDVGDNFPCTLLTRMVNWVAIEWGEIIIVGCYCSPRMSDIQFGAFLNLVSTMIDPNLSRQILLLGDFNARSLQWDKKQNKKGEILANWAVGRGLTLVNRDSTPTCVRSQGSSTVDLAWATPAMYSRIRKWYVDGNNPSASDHLYIRMTLRSTLAPIRERAIKSRNKFPRWNGKKINPDQLLAAIMAKTWCDRRHLEESVQIQVS